MSGQAWPNPPPGDMGDWTGGVLWWTSSRAAIDADAADGSGFVVVPLWLVWGGEDGPMADVRPPAPWLDLGGES